MLLSIIPLKYQELLRMCHLSTHCDLSQHTNLLDHVELGYPSIISL